MRFFVLLLALLCSTASAGSLTPSWTEDTTGAAYPLYGQPYRDWAVWGSASIQTGTASSALAYLQKGGYGQEAPPINPTLYPGFGAVGGTYLTGGVIGPFSVNAAGDEYYGGIALRGAQTTNAGLLLSANLKAGEAIRVWMRSYDIPFIVTAAGAFSPTVTATKLAGSYGYVDFTTDVDDVVNVVVQQAADTTGEVGSQSFYIGAAAIVGVVPEPGTMALACTGLLPLLCLRRRR